MCDLLLRKVGMLSAGAPNNLNEDFLRGLQVPELGPACFSIGNRSHLPDRKKHDQSSCCTALYADHGVV